MVHIPGTPLAAHARPQDRIKREVSLMIMGQNIWLVIIVVFIILVVLGVITVAT